MATEVQTARSLREAATQQWRHFIWMWLWPVFFYTSWLLLGAVETLSTERGTFITFLVVEVPAFVIANHKAGRPRKLGAVTNLQAAFWTMLVPFLIWIFVCMLPFGLFYVAEKVGAHVAQQNVVAVREP
jgi:hypothetical protein